MGVEASEEAGLEASSPFAVGGQCCGDGGQVTQRTFQGPRIVDVNEPAFRYSDPFSVDLRAPEEEVGRAGDPGKQSESEIRAYYSVLLETPRKLLVLRAPLSWEVPDCSERLHHWAPENRRGQASKRVWNLHQPLWVGP